MVLAVILIASGDQQIVKITVHSFLSAIWVVRQQRRSRIQGFRAGVGAI